MFPPLSKTPSIKLLQLKFPYFIKGAAGKGRISTTGGILVGSAKCRAGVLLGNLSLIKLKYLS